MPPTGSPTESVEPFPALTVDTGVAGNVARNDHQKTPVSPVSPGAPRRTRTSSLLQSFMESNPPLGAWQATGEVGSKIPTLPEIRTGAFSADGWSSEGQMERRGTNPHEIHRVTRARRSTASSVTRSPLSPRQAHQAFPARVEEGTDQEDEEGLVEGAVPKTRAMDTVELHPTDSQTDTVDLQNTNSMKEPDETGTYPNGYRFPKKHTWGESIAIGLRAFWNFFLTPSGFLITVYCLNIVGWGAMIFFVLLEAVDPGMCVPTCTDKNSARQIWIEVDSQVLNGLFCVTGFGLIPWRFRDFYYLMKWRVGGDYTFHRKLAGIYRGWYRLPGSESLPDHVAPPPKLNEKKSESLDSPPAYSESEILELESNNALPLPATSIPDPPLTGVRAPATKSWNLDIVIWMYVWNTFIQAALAGIMWGLTRHTRPSWATGFLISIGCITGIVAGIVVFIEGSKVKKVEGIPVQEYDVLESIEDFQARKAKDDAKLAKKAAKKEPDEDRLVHTKKVKGESWFTRG